MEQGILSFLQGADRTMAWAAAVALAAGGTAMIVAFYLQWQRWRASSATRRAAKRESAAAKKALARPGKRRFGKPQPEILQPGTKHPTAPAAGVAAYRRQAGVAPQAVPPAEHAAVEQVAPEPAPRLDPLLIRLQDAADRLEELMRRHAHRTHEQDDLERLAAAIDVEFLHKQA